MPQPIGQQAGSPWKIKTEESRPASVAEKRKDESISSPGLVANFKMADKQQSVKDLRSKQSKTMISPLPEVDRESFESPYTKPQDKQQIYLEFRNKATTSFYDSSINSGKPKTTKEDMVQYDDLGSKQSALKETIP